MGEMMMANPGGELIAQREAVAQLEHFITECVKNELRHIVEGDIDGVFYIATTIAQRAKDRLEQLRKES
jgi:hypothetical protein